MMEADLPHHDARLQFSIGGHFRGVVSRGWETGNGEPVRERYGRHPCWSKRNAVNPRGSGGQRPPGPRLARTGEGWGRDNLADRAVFPVSHL